MLRTNVEFFLLSQLLIFCCWEMSSVCMGLCKHIKWKFYICYRYSSWRKKLRKKKEFKSWKLIVKNILWTDCETERSFFFSKTYKKSQMKSCTQVHAETENVLVFIDYFCSTGIFFDFLSWRKITKLTKSVIVSPFVWSLNFPMTFLLVSTKYSNSFGYLLRSKHFLSFQKSFDTSSEEIFRFDGTFKKWFEFSQRK